MPRSDASSPTIFASANAVGGARRIRVLLPLPLPDPLDYLVPPEAAPPGPGGFVRVPLGGRNLVGVVWDGEAGDLPAERLRPFTETLPTPPVPTELRRFVERVA